MFPAQKNRDKIANMYHTNDMYTLKRVETQRYIQMHNYVTEVCNKTYDDVLKKQT